MRTFLTDQLDDFASGLIDRDFGTIHVSGATAYLDEDSAGEVGTFFVLVLSDPEGDTWPLDDVFELRRSIRTEALAQNLSGPFYFEFRPTTPEELASDETEQGQP